MHKILLVEDDRKFSAVLKDDLEEEGYAVDLCEDGVEAVLNFISYGKDYDFVLLDIKMPKLDGINALKIIKRLNPNVPAITFSGNAGSGEMAESVKAGSLRCLVKPFELDYLKAEIKKYILRHCGV